ncbi:MAG: tRNA-dihydrouridine synthase [Gallionella sp.]|nr:tRNA-dihydrouridine synthase [Gallionella sp.]
MTDCIDDLIVHARTRADRYRPPARWEWLAQIRETVKLPVVANGEVWTTALSKHPPGQRLHRRHDRARRHHPP